jgi:ribosomal protein S18 acetylase RimI-like enzyme
MIIEKANVSDAKEILLLQKLVYRNEAGTNDFGIDPIQTIDQIEKDFDKCIFLKAVIDNKIIGSVKVYEKEGTCHIGRLVVHPDFQNRGIGTKLLYLIEKIFGYKRFELFTGDESPKNLYFYQKLGYKIFKEQKIDKINYIYLEKKSFSEHRSGKVDEKL